MAQILDSLHAYSGLSLFSRTVKSLSIPLFPRLLQSDDLQQTLIILESMSFARESLKEGTGTTVASQDPKMNPIPIKLKRRIGVRLSSFNPMTSQPPQNEPIVDEAPLQRRKYSGASVIDTLQKQPSKRPLRPGLRGRKRDSFKPTCTDSYLTDDINLEASEKENPITSEQSLERTTAAHVTTADTKVDGSTVDTAKNLKNTVIELLSSTLDELGDVVFKLLEERLQIKPINVEEFSLPKFKDFRKMDLKASVSSSSNRRTALSDISNALKGINSVAARQNSQSPSSNPSDDADKLVTIASLSNVCTLYKRENDNTDTACGVEVENAQEEVHNSSHEKPNKQRSRESCDNNRGKRSKTTRDESELMKILPHESGVKKQTKPISNEREEKKQMKTVTRESKMNSRWKSLEGAGAKWESGIRRSTRIKSRPLEYWRGERFLFGRIHESLSTVIGIKYGSPDKGALKVRSFVSNDYKEMIDFAALH